MEINEVLGLLPALLAGIALGVLFFGGLWFTVNKGLRLKRPALIFIASLVIRMTIVVLGFYYIGADNWQKMIVSLVGFLLARIVITRYTNKENKMQKVILKQEVNEN